VEQEKYRAKEGEGTNEGYVEGNKDIKH